MKKAFYKKAGIYFFLVLCLFLFNFACGLDVFTMLASPSVVVDLPSVDLGYTERKFEFYTNETEGVFFTGTAVYYKIYNSPSTLRSETTSLNNTANDSENNYNAPYRLIENYAYKTLKADNADNAVLIPYTGENKRVYIRLSDYEGMEAYSAQIKVNGQSLAGTKTVPMRDFSSPATFNFTGSSSENKIPASDDDDVKYTSGSGEDGVWYVALFAVAVGHDATYTPVYSNILYLGAVKIDRSEIK